MKGNKSGDKYKETANILFHNNQFAKFLNRLSFVPIFVHNRSAGFNSRTAPANPTK